MSQRTDKGWKDYLAAGSKILIAVLILIMIVFSTQLVQTVKKGEYDILQYPVTGTMKVIMDPGMYIQAAGDYVSWPKQFTYYFTSDKDASHDSNVDRSIEVRFVDGSVANISGTCLVTMPASSIEALALTTDQNFKDWRDFEARMIQPLVRKAMRNAANMMNARESYAEKRQDFIQWTWDQIEYGAYQTKSVKTTVTDPITGQKVEATAKEIKLDLDGNILRENNPLVDTGVILSNFEVKQFVYSDKVRDQITGQQEALMGIATARANAERAVQETKTAEEQGKKTVMEVRYTQLQEKEKQVVLAEQRLDVAVLDRKAAFETKQKDILIGEGQAAKKRLAMQADGALKIKIDAWTAAQKYWADAYTARKVPSVIMGGNGAGTGTDGDVKLFMDMMNVSMAKQLSLDMNLKGDTSK